MQNLEQKELEKLQELNTSFNRLKVLIGDLALQKQDAIENIKQIQNMFSDLEKELIEKYGENSVINLETGEVTQKNQ